VPSLEVKIGDRILEPERRRGPIIDQSSAVGALGGGVIGCHSNKIIKKNIQNHI